MPHSHSAKRAAGLDGQNRLLLLVHAMFAVANFLSGTFVNVYVWKAKQDYALIGWFAFSHQLTMAITFFLAGKWVKEHNKMLSLRLGIALAAVFYILVLWFGEQAPKYILLLGAVQGMSSAFFWLAFNVVYFEVTNRSNRDAFNGWAGLLGSAAGMIAPWVSGFLITRMEGGAGYRLIFTLSLAVFIAGTIVSFFLRRRPSQPHYEWLYGLRQLFVQGNPWRRVFPALIAQGAREGVFIFLIGLMVYVATKSELLLGNYSLITSSIALLAFYLAGKWLTPRRRSAAMLIGTLSMTAVILPFFWNVSYTTLLIFGIATAVFFPLYSVPITSSVFDMIGVNDESASHRVEYVVLRETALNAGRMLGTLIFIGVVSFTSHPSAMAALMLGLGGTPVLSWWLLKPILNRAQEHAGEARRPSGVIVYGPHREGGYWTDAGRAFSGIMSRRGKKRAR